MLRATSLPSNRLELTVLEFPMAGNRQPFSGAGYRQLVAIRRPDLSRVAAGLMAYAGFVRKWGNNDLRCLIFIGFLVEFAYFAFFEIGFGMARTPGKRWTHLRVITDSGRPVNAQNAILRNCWRSWDSLPSCMRLVSSQLDQPTEQARRRLSRRHGRRT